jgi:arylsulfatase A-like enzyme
MKNIMVFGSRVRYSVILIFISFAILFSHCRPRAFERPNIIFIMADDLGYKDIGCFGNIEIHTPSLDRLAAEGLKLTDYHSNGAVCSPTRAALLTGRYQQRSGLEGVIYARNESRHTGLDVKEFTMADFMKDAGYATGIVGKWHLGYKIEFNPLYQGFDFFRGFVSGNIDYHSHVDNSGIPDWWHNLEKVEESGYTTDLITNHALTFIEKNQNNPFFLYVSHAAPHTPFQGRQDKAERFSGAKFTYEGSVKNKKRAYTEMIEAMDDGIGEILNKLDELNLSDNTMIVFCSDNGGYEGYTDNGNLRGFKGSLWEGGHRVPAIIRWPGYIKPGTFSHQTVMSMDFFPTFVNLSKSGKKRDFRFDGTDLTRMLIEEQELPMRTLFWKYRNQKVARNGKWKLLFDKDSAWLFDLEQDIEEQNNLVNQQTGIADQLKLELEVWEMEVMKSVKLKTN